MLIVNKKLYCLKKMSYADPMYTLCRNLTKKKGWRFMFLLMVSPTLSVTNESQARDKFCCKTKSEMTMSAIKWKDNVCCKTFSVKRHCQFRHFLLRHCWLWDIFSYCLKRHCPLWDIFSFQTFAVFIKKTLSLMRYFQFSDICSF